jgi:hypothetical protein
MLPVPALGRRESFDRFSRVFFTSVGFIQFSLAGFPRRTSLLKQAGIICNRGIFLRRNMANFFIYAP